MITQYALIFALGKLAGVGLLGLGLYLLAGGASLLGAHYFFSIAKGAD